MPRGKAADRKPTPSAAPKSVGDLNDQQQTDLAIKARDLYVRSLDAKKKYSKQFLDDCKKIRADLGPDGVAIVKAMVELETPEGEAKVAQRIRAQAAAQKYKGLPIGTQIAMLLDEPDRTPSADRAYTEGRQASAEGKSAKPPHDPSTEQYHKWMDGYNDHHKRLVDGMAPKAGDDKDVRPAHLKQREAERAAAGAH